MFGMFSRAFYRKANAITQPEKSKRTPDEVFLFKAKAQGKRDWRNAKRRDVWIKAWCNNPTSSGSWRNQPIVGLDLIPF